MRLPYCVRLVVHCVGTSIGANIASWFKSQYRFWEERQRARLFTPFFCGLTGIPWGSGLKIVRRKLGLSSSVLLLLILFSASYVGLAGSTVRLATIQYDEFNDLLIASSLWEHPLSGLSRDGSQARFPMYVTAVVQALQQFANPGREFHEALIVSRWISVIMIVVAIWATYWLGATLFGQAAALLAAALFTFSPLILHFGRDALTQGDAFTPAPVLLALISFEVFQRRRTTLSVAILSLFLALAIAAKFLLAVLIPALITYQVLTHQLSSTSDPSTRARSSIDWPFTMLAFVAAFSALLALIFATPRFGLSSLPSALVHQGARLFWLFALLTIFGSCLLALRHSSISSRRHGKIRFAWSVYKAWLAILPLTFAIVLAVFPDHIFNARVASSLVTRTVTMDGTSQFFAATPDSARLFIGLIVLKLGLPLGIVSCIALLWALRRAAVEKGVLLLVITLAYYSLLLTVLPLQQPFWLVSVYPLILLLLSHFIVTIYRGFKSHNAQVMWACLVGATVLWLIVGLVRVYPTFGYYGYELIGERWLGRESRGYRKVIVVTNDGSTEALDWLRLNVPPDSTVISYLDDVHIINYFARVEPLGFALEHAVQYADRGQLAAELASADFVVVRVPDDLGIYAPVTSMRFIQLFGTEPVYEIVRGRGPYRMPVIQIYRRL